MVRITPKDAEGLLAAYAKVHAPKEEPKIEEPAGETPPPTESSENNK
tara:strand:+ start:85 stop:225 length:141 start_codon:yes stop_codon:yes gene_type:complete